MKRLLEAHRRRFRDFDLIHLVDEQEIARIRSELDVPAPTTLRWTWDYAERVSDLRDLYERGKAAQWNAETDLDWSTPLSRDEWVLDPKQSQLALLARLNGADAKAQRDAAFDELAHLISQLLHGEQAALQISGQLTNSCADLDAKCYAASQAADEARHVEVLAKFLSRKMGCVYPISPVTKVLLDLLLAAETPEKKLLGFQCLFEGVALGIFQLLRSAVRHPLLVEILQRIALDEARHAAFGMLVLRRVVQRAEPAVLVELEDFAFAVLEALNANQRLDTLTALGPRHGVDPWQATRIQLAMPDFARRNSRIYARAVIPNLRSLGLVSERTRGEYERLGMMLREPAP